MFVHEICLKNTLILQISVNLRLSAANLVWFLVGFVQFLAEGKIEIRG